MNHLSNFRKFKINEAIDWVTDCRNDGRKIAMSLVQKLRDGLPCNIQYDSRPTDDNGIKRTPNYIVNCDGHTFDIGFKNEKNWKMPGPSGKTTSLFGGSNRKITKRFLVDGVDLSHCISNDLAETMVDLLSKNMVNN